MKKWGLNEPKRICDNFCSKRKENVVVINLENLFTKVLLSTVRDTGIEHWIINLFIYLV